MTYYFSKTYSTPMTLLIIDWNSSSVYSRVGKGTIRILEGLYRVHGCLKDKCVPDKFDGGISTFSVATLAPVCWAAKIMNESNTCWSCKRESIGNHNNIFFTNCQWQWLWFQSFWEMRNIKSECEAENRICKN